MVWTGARRRLGLALILVATVGCGDDAFTPFADDDDDAEPEPPPMVDYSACGRSMRDPACVGTECALTPAARDHLQVMLDVVEAAGHGAAFTPTQAKYTEATQALTIDYQLHVSWFRVATSITLDVPQSADILRQELAAHVSGWDLPSGVARPEHIALAIEGCHALLSYDPCEDNRMGFVAHARYDWEQPDCVYKTSYAVVSAATGSTLECVVEQERRCD